MYEELKKAVCQANIELNARNLVICSWGNISGIDRTAGVVAIKPSGVPYDELTDEKMVLLDLDGNVIKGDLRPSSDAPTHIELYSNFETIGGVCHTHSTSATMWAQACKPIPCFGTTHADYFYGEIPVTDSMTEKEIDSDYELNTGKIITRRFEGMDPMQTPAVLVANHGPFTWGKNPADSVEAAFVLEQVAKMALGTIMINSNQNEISQKLLDKHYLRKHGVNAYYGQE
ncbi:MAG TPA: L-ribulose-5-phosphate 4-epimerase [Phycisphaerae bacterium]|nr:L-ribulose-5-phosphate 4-epimerase [Phycisphaerae bacterium]